jgi:hypothetical protein
MIGWGPWHEGTTLDVRVWHDGKDHYPNDFSCKVEVRERDTQKVTKHRGRGKFIGNFSPIWITYKGREVQIEQLLRSQTDPTTPCRPGGA